MLRPSNSQPGVCRQKSTFATVHDDGLAAKDQQKRKVQHVQHSLSNTEDERKDIIESPCVDSSSQPSYRSYIHIEVPPCFTSAVFLNKSLLISLVELDERRVEPTLCRSFLSIGLGDSGCVFPAVNKPAKIHEGYRKPALTRLDHDIHNCRSCGLKHCRDPLIKPRQRKNEQMEPTYYVNSKADDSVAPCHSNTLGLLSFRRPNHSNTKAGGQKRNADEAAFLTQSDFRHRQHTSITGPGMNFITLLPK